MDLAHAEELLAAYNSVVTIYLNPRNTQETKSYISRILTAFEGQVQALVNHTAAIIANMRARNRPHVDSMVYAQSLFTLISDQLNTGNFHIIYVSDLRAANNQNQRNQPVQPAGPIQPGAGGPGGPEEDSSSDDELPTTAPVAPYNDVRNDPYFVMR